MATITHIKTPDGVIHDVGGGGGSSTYTLTKSGSTITLTGSGGDVSSVVDSNTTYTISISGHTLTLTPSSGTAQTVTVPDDNTTYTISVSGSTITLTPSSGSAQTITIPDATTSASGVMSASDKSKLNGIASGAEVNVQSDWNQTDSTADDYIKNKPTIPPGVTVDSALSTTSTNPVENRVITNALDNKVDKETGKGLSTNDFTTAEKNKLAGIQAGAEVNVQADWNEADSTADDYIKNKPTLATVATTGDYDDLSDKPTIPTVSVTQKTSIGTNIADITINGSTTQLYAPSGGGGAIEYTLSGSGDDDEYTITATPTSGTATSATIPAANQTDAGVMTAADKTKLDGVATGAEVNVQSDWNEANSSSDAYILNKPTIPTATSDLINDSDFVSKGDPVRVGEYYEDAQTHAIEIGNGTISDPSNSLSVDWNGNVVTNGGGTFHGAITREATEAERIAASGTFVRVIVTGVSEYTEDQKIYLGVGGNGSNMGIYLPAHGVMTNGYFLIREYYASGTPRIEIGSSDANGVRALGHSSNIGTISSSDGSKSIASGGSMLKVADLFTLPAGAWVVCVGVQFPDNSTGTRAARLYFDGAAAATAYQAYPAGAGVRAMNLSAVVNIGSSSDVDLYARQNSGSSMTVTYWARAMRII